MAWDRTLPTGSTAVSASDNAIRANWDYIRSAFAQEHADPDANAADPTAIRHTQGSARAIVYTGATELDSSADVVAQVSQLYHDATDIGRIVYDLNSSSNPGRIWVCTDIDTFVVAPTVADALTLSGLLTANAGIVIPSGQTLQLASGEDSLTDGSVAFDPWAHVARHLQPGGADAIPNLITAIHWDYTEAQIAVIDETDTKLAEVSVDFTGRSGSSHVFVLGAASVQGTQDTSFQLKFGLDSNGGFTEPGGANLPASLSASPRGLAGQSNDQYYWHMCIFTEIVDLNADAHTIELWTLANASLNNARHRLLCVLDLGLD